MKITILVDDRPIREVLHEDETIAFSLAHRALVELQAEAAQLVELIETKPDDDSPAAAAPVPVSPGPADPTTSATPVTP